MAGLPRLPAPQLCLSGDGEEALLPRSTLVVKQPGWWVSAVINSIHPTNIVTYMYVTCREGVKQTVILGWELHIIAVMEERKYHVKTCPRHGHEVRYKMSQTGPGNASTAPYSIKDPRTGAGHKRMWGFGQ